MSKYFTRNINSELKYPEEIKYIREYMEQYGKINCSDNKLDELWRDYSNCYSAIFLIPSEELINGFMDYLDEIK